MFWKFSGHKRCVRNCDILSNLTGSGSEQEESVHIDEVTRVITCNSILGYRVIYRDVVTF